MSLVEELQKNETNVSATSYSMSVGELASMYSEGELDLHPEFQRFFRWTPEQKSRLVESLLLGIPIPPIFVAERGDAKWDVIDGLQRLSTVLEVMGELRTPEGEPMAPLELTGTKYLPSLHGLQWGTEDNGRALPAVARIKLKRARFDLNIIRSSSEHQTKYEIFQRLNTGGSIATDQEVRNCILVMVNPDFFTWLRELANFAPFQECLSLSERAAEEAYDMELLVRYLVLVDFDFDGARRIDELGSFLTDRAVKLAEATPERLRQLKASFEATFTFLATNVSDNAFRRYSDGRYRGAMSVSIYEVVACGLGSAFLADPAWAPPTDFTTRHQGLWAELGPEPFVGSGIGASTRLPRTIAYGRAWVLR